MAWVGKACGTRSELNESDIQKLGHPNDAFFTLSKYFMLSTWSLGRTTRSASVET
jgi:hypothetical protein